ncbi:triadin-like [Sarcophilus harrisii]
MKLEKSVSQSKPEEKIIKQVKTATIDKAVKSKSTKQTEHQIKEIPTAKADKKKIEKPEKESKEKTSPKKQLKDHKDHFKNEETEANRDTTGKENLLSYNVTREKTAHTLKAMKDFDEVPSSKKVKEETEDVTSMKKEKTPISFFQCVYLDGYNGYGFQFPVTPAHQSGSSSHSKSPEQKQQGQ